MSAIATDLCQVWQGYVDPDGRCAWNLGVLVWVDGINDKVETEDGVTIAAANLIRYLQVALPRALVLPPERVALAELCRAELRAITGGSL